MRKPLAIDLFCGVGGFSEGALLEGYDCVGFDNERHVYGDIRYPAQLVIQDVLTLHGSQFKDAALIWASPPCQAYSWMAMPWSLAKAKAAAIRADATGMELERLNRLFNACFRIQREACEAAGKHIPMIVENVRGAQPWVGRARWNYGSFYLFGDVPALMPITFGKAVMKEGIAHRPNGETNFHGYKTQGMNWSDQTKRGQDFTRIAGRQALANTGIKVGNASERRWEDRPIKRLRDAMNGDVGCKVPSEDGGRRTDAGKGARFTSRDYGPENVVLSALAGAGEGRKGYAKVMGQSEISRAYGSKSPQRKMASAMIAKIPEPLARHIARTYRP